MIRDCAAWGIDPALAAESVVRIETEAAAPDAGLREAALDPNYSDEFIGNLYRAALAAHRSSDPSPAPAPDRCSECGRAFEVIPHVHEGVKCEPKHIHDLNEPIPTEPLEPKPAWSGEFSPDDVRNGGHSER